MSGSGDIAQPTEADSIVRALLATDPRTGMALDPDWALDMPLRLKASEEATANLHRRLQSMKGSADEALVTLVPVPRIFGAAHHYVSLEPESEDSGVSVRVPRVLAATFLRGDGVVFTLTIESTPNESSITGITVAPVVGSLDPISMRVTAVDLERWRAWAVREASHVRTTEWTSDGVSFLGDMASDHPSGSLVDRLSPRRRRVDSVSDDFLRHVANRRRSGVPAAKIAFDERVLAEREGEAPHRSTIYKWLKEAERRGL